MTTAGPCRWQGPDLRLELQVQPRAGRDAVTGLHGDRIKVRLTAPPVDDKANDHLLRFLAGEFGVARRDVALLAGHKSRRKTVVVREPKRVPDWLAEIRDSAAE